MVNVEPVGRIPQEVRGQDLEAMLRGAIRVGLEVCLDAELDGVCRGPFGFVGDRCRDIPIAALVNPFLILSVERVGDA